MASKRSSKRAPSPPPEPPVPLAEARAAKAQVTPWERPAGLSRRGVGVLVAIVLAINLPLLHRWLRGAPETTVQIPFTDDFSGSSPLSQRYFSAGGDWRVRDGVLISPGVRNNALWLRAALPDAARIAFDARAVANDADIRVELFGNGTDALSGYRLVLTGKGESARGVLLRLGEAGLSWSDVQARAGTAGPVQAGLYAMDTAMRVEGASLALKTTDAQRWVIERRGDTLRWTINGERVLDFTDPLPLRGAGHDRVGLSSGEMDVLFDGLSVGPSGTEPFVAMAEAPPRRTSPAPLAGPFEDLFDRATLGPDWRATAPDAVRLEAGALTLERAHNHPVWLTRPLPPNAVIELDAWSDSPEGDLKVEAWGDGTSAHEGDLRAAYEATGYVFVMGGWRNTRSLIARREEHGAGASARTDVRVEPGRKYHWRITRQGSRLTWEVDGKPFLALDDPQPLVGPQQAYFAFSDWETRVHFDNLRIGPLP